MAIAGSPIAGTPIAASATPLVIVTDSYSSTLTLSATATESFSLTETASSTLSLSAVAAPYVQHSVVGTLTLSTTALQYLVDSLSSTLTLNAAAAEAGVTRTDSLASTLRFSSTVSPYLLQSAASTLTLAAAFGAQIVTPALLTQNLQLTATASQSLTITDAETSVISLAAVAKSHAVVSELAQSLALAGVASTYLVPPVVQSTLTLTSVLTETQTLGDSAVSAIALTGSVQQYLVDSLTSTLTTSGAVTSQVVTPALVTQALTLSASVNSHGVLAEQSASSVLSLSASYTDVLTAVDTLVTVLELDAEVIAPLSGTAWTAAIGTLGVSRYTDFNYGSMAESGGVLLAAGETGIFAIDAITEQDAAIDAVVELPITDFGEPKLKRFRRVIVPYIADGQLQLELRAGNWPGRAAKQFYAKTLPRTTDFPSPIPAKPGRGVKTRYVQPVIRNIGGAYFQLVDPLLVQAHVLERHY